MHEIFPFDPFAGITGEQNPRDDRARAILASASLELALENSIASKFLQEDARQLIFDGDTGVLRDFSSKSKIAYGLGIVGRQTLDDLDTIRRIRNAFAHSRVRIDFDTAEINFAASLLSSGEREKARRAGSEIDNEAATKTPRDLYFFCCFEYTLWLFGGSAAKEDSWMMKLLRS